MTHEQWTVRDCQTFQKSIGIFSEDNKGHMPSPQG